MHNCNKITVKVQKQLCQEVNQNLQLQYQYWLRAVLNYRDKLSLFIFTIPIRQDRR